MTMELPLYDSSGKLSADFLADLIVDNGEAGAQVLIADKVLRDSLVLNAKAQVQRVHDFYAVELASLRSELERWKQPIDNTGDYVHPVFKQLDELRSALEGKERRIAADYERTELVRGLLNKEIDRLQAQLSTVLEEAKQCVPTNWCDPLLTGEDKVADFADCPAIERLLTAIRDRIRSLSPTPLSGAKNK